jgi:hypothetical protein
MIKKGASRKGQRRRQAIAAAGARDEEEIPQQRPPEDEPIKLDPVTVGLVKTIARIEAKPGAREEMRLSKHDELSWGRQRARRDYRWVLLFSFLAIGLLFSAIAMVNRRSGQNTGTSPALPGIVLLSDDLDEHSPLFAFQQNPYQMRLDAIKILRQVAAATKAEQILPFIRQTPDTQALLTKHWKPWASPPLLDDPDQLLSDIDETSGTAFLWLQGTHQDGSDFLAFFVKEGDALRLDWEATMELGEARLSTLAKLPTTHPISLRVILAPSPYYLPTLPESDYESYKITSLNEETIVWGYVRRGTPEHQQINDLLQHDSLLLDAVSSVRARVKLRRTDDVNSQNRFFITEMLHKDWVMP